MKAPFSYDTAIEMFRYVAENVGTYGCDNTMRFTRKWLMKHFDHDLSKVSDAMDFLMDNGGYCDCEVLLNTDHKNKWK